MRKKELISIRLVQFNTHDYMKIYSLLVDMQFSVSEWKIKHTYHFRINRKYLFIKTKKFLFLIILIMSKLTSMIVKKL